jgi:dihydrofolate reductase
MRKIIQIAHTSLDGFVAGPNGDLEWFENAGEHLDFVNELTNGADALLMGRISHQMLDSYWPSAKDAAEAKQNEIAYSNWYNKATKYVISKTQNRSQVNNTSYISNNIKEAIVAIKNQKGDNILIFGSPSIFQLLSSFKLIDEYWVFVNPILFGTGIPLFASMNEKIKLNLLEIKKISNGEVALHYETICSTSLL